MNQSHKEKERSKRKGEENPNHCWYNNKQRKIEIIFQKGS